MYVNCANNNNNAVSSNPFPYKTIVFQTTITMHSLLFVYTIEQHKLCVHANQYNKTSKNKNITMRRLVKSSSFLPDVVKLKNALNNTSSVQ